MTLKSLLSLLHARKLRMVRSVYAPHMDAMIGRAVTKRGREIQVPVTGLDMVRYGSRKLKRLVNKQIDGAMA